MSNTSRVILLIGSLTFCFTFARGQDSHVSNGEPVKISSADSSSKLYESPSDPDPNDFVDVEQEPKPLVSMDSLFVYPEEAQKNGIEGKVLLRMLINEKGQVTKVAIDRGAAPILNDAAERVAWKMKFTPAIANGHPIRVWLSQTISFRLNP
jgi:protein TonB